MCVCAWVSFGSGVGGGEVYAGHVWIPLGWMSKESQGGPIRAAKAGFTLITIIRYRSLTLSLHLSLLPPVWHCNACLIDERSLFFSVQFDAQRDKRRREKKSLKMGFLCPMWKFIREVSGDGRSWAFLSLFPYFSTWEGDSNVGGAWPTDAHPRSQVQEMQFKLKHFPKRPRKQEKPKKANDCKTMRLQLLGYDTKAHDMSSFLHLLYTNGIHKMRRAFFFFFFFHKISSSILERKKFRRWNKCPDHGFLLRCTDINQSFWARSQPIREQHSVDQTRTGSANPVVKLPDPPQGSFPIHQF